MRNFKLLALLIAMLTAWSPGSRSGVILRGKGDFEFFGDITSVPVRGGGTLELFQIAIPTKEITYEEEDGVFNAAVRVRISLRRRGEKISERSIEIWDKRSTRPRERDLSGFLYMTDSSLVAPGIYSLEIKVEDLKRAKKTLIGLFKKNYYYSLLEDIGIEVPAYGEEEMVLSDPLLIWSRKRGEPGFIPNPMGIYGLKNDTLSFYVSALAPRDAASDSIDFHVSVFSESGEFFSEDGSRAPVVDGQASFLGHVDLISYPAGRYRFFIVAQDQEGRRANCGKDFSVAWELVNWQKPSRDLMVEARILLMDVEFVKFQNSSLGEQESMLKAHWKKVDPTPHTAVNEVFEKFVERLAYADNQYGVYTRGALSDRGQIYVRFGMPSEIQQQNMPFNRDNLAEAIGKLEDQYQVVTHRTSPKGPEAPSSRVIDMRGFGRPFRGSEGFDVGAYELWIYNMKGDPINERDRFMTVSSGLRFLFVDLDGYGDFRLVGTSEEFRP